MRRLKKSDFVLTCPALLSPMRLPPPRSLGPLPRPASGRVRGHVLNSCILSPQFLQSPHVIFFMYQAFPDFSFCLSQ